MQPLVEVHLGIFHRRLVRTGIVQSFLVQRAPAAVHALAQDVVLDRGLRVRRLLRLDELALEQRDLLGIVELHHVGRAPRRTRDQVRDDQHVRVPLQHQSGEVRHPERAVLGLAAVEELEAGVLPAFIGRRAGLLQTRLRRDDLHRVVLAVIDGEVVAVGEVAEPGVEGLGNFTDCNNFTVDYGEHHSVQIVAPKAGLEKPGTPAYKRWQDACLKFLDGREPKYGALWMTYFPGLMLEWYPNVLVVSHLIPRSARPTTNVG